MILTFKKLINHINSLLRKWVFKTTWPERLRTKLRIGYAWALHPHTMYTNWFGAIARDLIQSQIPTTGLIFLPWMTLGIMLPLVSAKPSTFIHLKLYLYILHVSNNNRYSLYSVTRYVMNCNIRYNITCIM